jgi:hypothetical protein
MQWLQSTYTIRHNVKHRLRGHLFQGRFKAIPVDGEDGTYFRTVSDYIHLNPARALEKSSHGRPGPSKPVLLRCCRTAGHQKTCQEVGNVNRQGLTPLFSSANESDPKREGAHAPRDPPPGVERRNYSVPVARNAEMRALTGGSRLPS